MVPGSVCKTPPSTSVNTSVPSAAGHQHPERVLIIKKQVNESNFRGRKYRKMESV